MSTRLLLLAAVAMSRCPSAAVSDAPKIDRTIGKEPAYAHKPHYFILLFGPEAKTRIWCVLDGQKVLHVDRNGNGDVTEQGEQISLDEKEKVFLVGDITEKEGRTVHRAVRVSAPRSSPAGSKATSLTVSAEVRGEFLMVTHIAIDNTMAQRQDAPFRHFDGPLTVALHGKENWKFVRGHGQLMLNMSFGTYYAECKEWVSVYHDKGVPRDVYPLAVVAFPGKTPDSPPIVIKAPIYGRC